jgi:hypothetical protein
LITVSATKGFSTLWCPKRCKLNEAILRVGARSTGTADGWGIGDRGSPGNNVPLACDAKSPGKPCDDALGETATGDEVKVATDRAMSGSQLVSEFVWGKEVIGPFVGEFNFSHSEKDAPEEYG